MLETIVKVICNIIYALINFHVMKLMLLSDEKLLTKKNIALFLLLVILYIISYSVQYSIEIVILRFSVGILINGLMFDSSLYKTTVAYTMYMLLTLIADLLNTSVYMQFLSIEQIRNNYVFMLLTNFTVAITLYLMLKIKIITNTMQQLIKKINDTGKFQTMMFYILIYIILIALGYKIAITYKFNYVNIINYIMVALAFVVLMIYTANSLKYQKLMNEYDLMFNYVQRIEDIIDNITLNKHEYKNQLAVIKSYIESEETSKALKLIKESIKDSYTNDSKLLTQLKNVPKGGLKGLLYYKIIIANNNNLKLSVDISKSVSAKLKKLNLNEVKVLAKLIGIYFDNAIEASKESSKKLIALEIYSIDDEIEFVFTNSFKNQNVDINKFKKRGYTTKGKGHGNGLYLANKILEKNKWLEAKTEIVNKMYVQKLIVK